MLGPRGARVLVVEDEPPILRMLASNLRSHGMQVLTAATLREAMEKHATFRPDVILLDLRLPDGRGEELIRQVRLTSTVPIIVLSAYGEEGQKVAALEMGADDYLTKPFGVKELLARIRVALRRAAGKASGEPEVRVGELTLDLANRRVTVDGQQVQLTPTEYALLKVLAVHLNKVLTDSQLLNEVWGQAYGSEPHYLHVYVSRLRRKLGPAAKYLVTEPGVGYRLLSPEEL
ncbi:two component transcriptional regulator, winged helix family [Thermobaculum terrenum ATCC BAA-798]|uniref:Two component transcriptional regulator, winged helix family n=1 Tax=Thermobaculum terrenum (strain ATCC BAA-798 / CCMEE 7001 / YNP1) TaxID=525904 RepID=D1CGX6_THET1|nr:response regulator transcription factor [Thermobaculum terrenum]ACZ42997.1 two component transcriptional regulator, winged helix family [Thermobaculum terrenum ATCC BAA-798]